MAAVLRNCIFFCRGASIQTKSLLRNFHVSNGLLYPKVGEWRIKHGIPAKGAEYGPLTDLPDWSYADGRPAPLSEGQKRKIRLNKEYCEQIIKLSKEVDEVNELNMEKALKEESLRQKAIKNRLKQKGDPVD
ncbi:large ribosomal subunit protein mL52 [Parasteatoda tepidariorum]|uniref:large ribosomal subunit protein mL52 n=1 Tax=Parasteatoda tepidariorum TaxID=114398 RepID=UPI00077FC3B6|nr:39S ribosomal protein L52, mitochondrial [Parasteatoda tepidariorum]